MARRRHSGRGGPAHPLRSLARWATLLLGLVALAGGAAWSAVSVASGAGAPDDDAAARCPTAHQRRMAEREDCALVVQRELIEGRLDLQMALRRLEGCADALPELRAALDRRAELLREADRARLAFQQVGPPAAVQRLRRAGITPHGLAPRGDAALDRLRRSGALGRDFRAVFGPRTADDLDRLFRPGEPGPLRAVILGSSVVIPDDSAMPGGSPRPAPRTIPLSVYSERLVDQLTALEEERQAYLAAAGHANWLAGSVGGFVASLRWPNEVDETERAAARRAEAARSALIARLAALERRLGVDPALLQMARATTLPALELGAACGRAAAQRRHRVRTGAGVVTGLTGAAALVVATGAAGTLAGGVTIAAALEGVLGGYLALRSERFAWRAAAEAARQAVTEPTRAEERPFLPDEGAGSLRRGRAGEGRGESQDPREGEWEEWQEGEGEGEGEEGWEGSDDPTGPETHRSPMPAELPPPLPEDRVELPPLLSDEALQAMRRLTLAEAQARIDEFLALRPPHDAPRDDAAPAASDAIATSELIEEARAALRLWVERRELSPGFGEFFLRAELEELPASRRAEALRQVSDRYARDRAVYRGSTDLQELRRRVAERLVTHCRSAAAPGDLVLRACSVATALTQVVVAAVRDAGLAPPPGSVLGVQSRGAHFHPVLFHAASREVTSLIDGERSRGVTAPIYHPASFYYGYLVEHGARPEIDAEAHLLVAHPDPGAAAAGAACADTARRGLLSRAVQWLRSLVGRPAPSRRDRACDGLPGDGPVAADGEAQGGSGVQVSVATPGLPVPSGGGGQGGGGGGGSQGGGGADGAGQAGGGAAGGRSGAQAGGRNGNAGGASTGARGAQAGGGEGSSGAEGAGTGGGAGAGAARSGTGDGAAGGEGKEGGGSGGALDLGAVAREATELARAAREDGALRLQPWRLRDDYTFFPSRGRVLYADNEESLSRFRPQDRFLTMSPSDTEEQRRMFEADSFPVFPLGTECSAPGLPPRRVFRRATGAGQAFRYVFCDQDESMVAFRTREDARSYAALAAPDRPLFLTRLASTRIERFEGSEEVGHLRAFLRDPNTLLTLPTAVLDSMVSTAEALLTFQATLESALYQSMHALQGSAVRGHYYELHRQVAQSHFFLDLTAAVHRLNQRLSSDPLQTLAWADALPPERRQRFFRLYFALGGVMYWPARWEAQHRRYADGALPPTSDTRTPGQPSLDFLQVMSDPTRVQVSWPTERPRASRASIRDRHAQQGREKTHLDQPQPTDAEHSDRQDRIERRRGGTRGLGRAGEGAGQGPERGRRPLQMLHIRIRPETGDPDRPRLPADNPTRPGGTRGRRVVQERSASWQEPVLWVASETFVEAVLSGWDPPRQPPTRARRTPPVLRFAPRLRELFLRDLHRDKVYEGRLLYATSILTAGGWLRYGEFREAMGGSWQGVRAYDTGRAALEYSTIAAIVDQDQVRGPNLFTRTSVVIPADLLDAVRTIFNRHGYGNFDLGVVEPERPIPLPPPAPDSPEAAAARAELLRALQLISGQNRERRD